MLVDQQVGQVVVGIEPLIASEEAGLVFFGQKLAAQALYDVNGIQVVKFCFLGLPLLSEQVGFFQVAFPQVAIFVLVYGQVDSLVIKERGVLVIPEAAVDYSDICVY